MKRRQSIIIQGDCMEVMSRMEAQSVDVIVTSPPYNIGVDYGTHEDTLTPVAYLDWMELLAMRCRRVLRGDGSLFLNLGARPSNGLGPFEVLQMFMRTKAQFHLQNVIHWIKSLAAPEHGVNVGHYKPVNSDRYLHSAHEYIFHLTPTGDTKLDKLAIGVPYKDKSNIKRWKGADRADCRDRGNTWYIPYKTVTGAKPHPTSFPEALPELCIRLHGLLEDRKLVVLDPMCGSGTTPVVARLLGCYAIGIEIDDGYVYYARKRLNPHTIAKERRR